MATSPKNTMRLIVEATNEGCSDPAPFRWEWGNPYSFDGGGVNEMRLLPDLVEGVMPSSCPLCLVPLAPDLDFTECDVSFPIPRKFAVNWDWPTEFQFFNGSDWDDDATPGTSLLNFMSNYAPPTLIYDSTIVASWIIPTVGSCDGCGNCQYIFEGIPDNGRDFTVHGGEAAGIGCAPTSRLQCGPGEYVELSIVTTLSQVPFGHFIDIGAYFRFALDAPITEQMWRDGFNPFDVAYLIEPVVYTVGGSNHYRGIMNNIVLTGLE